MKNNYLPSTFFGLETEYSDADYVIFGAPFDGTTTFRPGARFAPQTMRIESLGLESYSPYFDCDLFDYNISDLGDLDLPFGSTKVALSMIQNTAKEIFQNNKKPVMIGGEHLVSLPIIREAYMRYNDLRVIHFDAHTDLRDNYLGERLSHATVMRRVWDFVGNDRIYQFGIRSGTKEEFYWAMGAHTSLNKYDFTGLKHATVEIGKNPVYLTIDLDVLDPSIMSGTGTTEAGGVTFNQLLDALKLVSKLNIVGADIVELSPHYDQSGVSTAVACKVLRELLFSIVD